MSHTESSITLSSVWDGCFERLLKCKYVGVHQTEGKKSIYWYITVYRFHIWAWVHLKCAWFQQCRWSSCKDVMQRVVCEFNHAAVELCLLSQPPSCPRVSVFFRDLEIIVTHWPVTLEDTDSPTFGALLCWNIVINNLSFLQLWIKFQNSGAVWVLVCLLCNEQQTWIVRVFVKQENCLFKRSPVLKAGRALKF